MLNIDSCMDAWHMNTLISISSKSQSKFVCVLSESPWTVRLSTITKSDSNSPVHWDSQLSVRLHGSYLRINKYALSCVFFFIYVCFGWECRNVWITQGLANFPKTKTWARGREFEVSDVLQSYSFLYFPALSRISLHFALSTITKDQYHFWLDISSFPLSHKELTFWTM